MHISCYVHLSFTNITSGSLPCLGPLLLLNSAARHYYITVNYNRGRKRSLKTGQLFASGGTWNGSKTNATLQCKNVDYLRLAMAAQSFRNSLSSISVGPFRFIRRPSSSDLSRFEYCLVLRCSLNPANLITDEVYKKSGLINVKFGFSASAVFQLTYVCTYVHVLCIYCIYYIYI